MAALNARRYVIVTGGAGGIGSAVCRLLPTLGVLPIIGFNTNVDQANALSEEIGGFAIQIDLGNSDSIIAAIDSISQVLGDQDTLVGAVLAASPPPDIEPFSSLNSVHFTKQFEINVIGPQLLLSRLIKKFFRKNRSGTIVGISSQAVGAENKRPATGMGAYVIAKAALNSLLSVCAAEYTWLKVARVSPGFTKTAMLEVFDPRYLEMIQGQQDFSSPEEVAKLIINEFKI